MGSCAVEGTAAEGSVPGGANRALLSNASREWGKPPCPNAAGFSGGALRRRVVPLAAQQRSAGSGLPTFRYLQEGINNRTEPNRLIFENPEPKPIEPNRFLPVSAITSTFAARRRIALGARSRSRRAHETRLARNQWHETNGKKAGALAGRKSIRKPPTPMSGSHFPGLYGRVRYLDLGRLEFDSRPDLTHKGEVLTNKGGPAENLLLRTLASPSMGSLAVSMKIGRAEETPRMQTRAANIV